MEGVLMDYFSSLLSETKPDRERDINEVVAHIPSLITPAQNDLLMKPVELGELEDALNQMKEGTAPGLDGFTINFFV